MQLNILTPFKSLNKAYLKEKVSRNNVELFKHELLQLFSKSEATFSEDTLKDFITEFLRNTWYNPNHAITINKERKDLSIHTGKVTKDPVGVIAEIKKIGSPEMISQKTPNVKAIHELVLYYLRERITVGNNEIKYLLASDVNNWILIDANEFDKKIYNNSKIKRLYNVYVNDKKDNPFFYTEVKRILDETEDTINATHFNLKDFKKYITNTDKNDDEKLIPLYKLLSPAHLLKLPFANDSNSLDKNFYTELLHIIGLEEIKEGSKKLIQRKIENSEASLLENAIIKLKDKESLREVPDVTRFGFTNEEQYYNIALELCITWVNRILFLKLLEAQLYSYHQKDEAYLFLNDAFIADFDELNNLFLQVLAEKPENRRERLKNKFSKVPYLNSSLFERTELERKTIDISALDNNLPLLLPKDTVLKDNKKRKQGGLPTLAYLFTFLNSYDFASEGKVGIQEENKNLINASVLGLIFEKINGYKDGSFFTPGFITMYMCRETLRRAVVQKFNDANNWSHTTFEELQEAIEYTDKEKRQYANDVINSLTICDPAVGSGHFLVSALNELISIKHDLKILQYRHNGQRINHKEYKVEIENDELIIQDIETEDFFKYTLNQKGNIKPELQYLQETLFHEKETLIENCLFGVDINANSVKICRLRLWIELLKNAYYTKETNYTQIETLPNIDINIKQGNSLISRFGLDADLSSTLKKSKTWSIDSYKVAVQTYRNAQSKDEKRQMEELIEKIKKDFRTDVATYDPINKKLSKLRGELALLQRTDLFSADDKKKTKANKELENISAAIEKLDKQKDDIQSSAIYKEAFEWRFEFPEVLDGDGKFLGFDVVIGNPPYISTKEMHRKGMQSEIALYNKSYQSTESGNYDIFIPFIERALNLVAKNKEVTLIIPNKFIIARYSNSLLNKILRDYFFLNFSDLSAFSVFEEASVYPIIIRILKTKVEKSVCNKQIISLNKNTFEIREVQEWNYISHSLERAKQGIGNVIIKKIENIETINTTLQYSPGINGFQFSNYGKCVTEGKGQFESKRLVVTGGIDRYTILNNKTRYKGIDYQLPFINYNREIISEGKWQLFSTPKIIVAGMTKKIEAAFDEFGEIAPAVSVYSILGPIKTLKFVLAILNSRLIDWYFKIRFQDKHLAGGYISINTKLLEKVPIPLNNNDATLISIIDKILAAKKENPKAVTSAWEKEIDELVYALYGLNGEEIKMVKGI